MSLSLKNLFIFLSVLFVLSFPILVSAQPILPCSPGNTTCYDLQPIGRLGTVTDLVCRAVDVLSTKIMPPVAVFMALYASFLLLISTGDPKKVQSSHQTILYTIIGAGVMLMASPLLALIVDVLGVESGKVKSGYCSKDVATSTFITAFTNLINWFAWGVGIVSVVMGLYAGFLYMTSKGDPKAAETANKTILYTVVGVIVAVLSFSIVQIIQAFTG